MCRSYWPLLSLDVPVHTALGLRGNAPRWHRGLYALERRVRAAADAERDERAVVEGHHAADGRWWQTNAGRQWTGARRTLFCRSIQIADVVDARGTEIGAARARLWPCRFMRAERHITENDDGRGHHLLCGPHAEIPALLVREVGRRRVRARQDRRERTEAQCGGTAGARFGSEPG